MRISCLQHRDVCRCTRLAPPCPSVVAKMAASVLIDRSQSPVFVVTINRPHVRNAVDGPTAQLLHSAFLDFAQDDQFSVAILKGAQGNFCAGADLHAAFQNMKEIRGTSDPQKSMMRNQRSSNDLNSDMDLPGPMGPTRMALPKPVIACIEGYALAGGLELSAWCDLRVASESAQLGLPCRTRGVPLIDGGTVRLPALIGHSHALDLILTGRIISAREAERMGLVNRVVIHPHDQDNNAVFRASLELAKLLSSKPQACLRHDRLSTMGVSTNVSSPTKPHACPFAAQGALREALENEFHHGLVSLTELGPALEEFIHRPRARKL